MDSAAGSTLDDVAIAKERRRWELSKLAWCIGTLLVLHVAGGSVYSVLERPAELDHYQRNRFLYKQMQEQYKWAQCDHGEFKNSEFCERQREFSGILKAFFERSGNEMVDHGKWTFFGSIFFVNTLVTTLGYGNFHPVTPAGQLFTVVFGLVGIPLMGYVLSVLGNAVITNWLPMFTEISTENRRIAVLCSLMIVFIFVGGGVFKLLEGWSYLEAMYFSTCTLFTIGFGDYLPSTGISRFFTMVFIMIGLGVTASFIALMQIRVTVHGEKFHQSLKSMTASFYGAVDSGGIRD